MMMMLFAKFIYAKMLITPEVKLAKYSRSLKFHDIRDTADRESCVARACVSVQAASLKLDDRRLLEPSTYAEL